MASFKQHELVELAVDLPTEGVGRGTVETIIEVYDTPGQKEACEIEVADKNGPRSCNFLQRLSSFA
jgi:hypothetical protein